MRQRIFIRISRMTIFTTHRTCHLLVLLAYNVTTDTALTGQTIPLEHMLGLQL